MPAPADSTAAPGGLTPEAVLESRRLHGPNTLTPPPRTPAWKQLLEKFDDQTIRILLVAAVLSLIMAGVDRWVLHGEGSFLDSLGIFLAVGLATLVAWLNERKSEKEFEILNRQSEDVEVEVVREGQTRLVPIAEVVVGDLVRARMGFKIPADGVLLSASSLHVDESLLTGESLPMAKRAQPEGREPGAEHKVFRGTMAVEGHGLFRVEAVGDRTELGKIAAELHQEDETTPLQEKLTTLADQIGLTGTVAATAIFTVMAAGSMLGSRLLEVLSARGWPFWALVGAAAALAVPLAMVALPRVLGGIDEGLKARGLRWIGVALVSLPAFVVLFTLGAGGWGYFTDPLAAQQTLEATLLAFVVAVTIVVVAVPEGLPMMVNVSLALNMRAMARQSCLVRKLVASETIGSATIICTDKTGTLTQNRMAPVWFHVGGRTFTGAGLWEVEATPEWGSLVQNASVNATAGLEHRAEGPVRVGNPTEAALLAALHTRGHDYRPLREAARVLWQVDFTSERKLSAVQVAAPEGPICYDKGAPERIIARCSHVRIGGVDLPLDEARRATLEAALAEASGRALRVLAFAERRAPEGCHGGSFTACEACTGRVLVGLVGIADPLREGVRESLATCRGAGVEVTMVTGDEVGTATAIARESGILRSEDDLVMTSVEFSKLDDAALQEVAPRIRVLARSHPLDKLRLVRALRQDGSRVVAVTGDGINDTPALKAADVGLAMGSGHQVAREASDIVLVDDNFASIVTGVRWGRALYQNIQRFLQFQLSVNVVALLCALVGPLVGYPLPFTVPQLLWINIIMDTFAALALSTDPPRAGAMSRPPVPRQAHVLTPAMSVTILINGLFQVAVLLWVLLANPFGAAGEIERLTVFFTVFVMFQFWHKFNCRALRHDESPFEKLIQNKNFLFIVGLITVAQVVMVQVGGPIGALFRTVPLPLATWGWILLLTASILPVAWLARWVAFWVGAEDRSLVRPR
ncbi:MAG: calcium-translocating P-type ATPase, PMCA-type [Pseudomonadota bacterium]